MVVMPNVCNFLAIIGPTPVRYCTAVSKFIGKTCANLGARKLNFAEPLAAPAAARLVLGKIWPAGQTKHFACGNSAKLISSPQTRKSFNKYEAISFFCKIKMPFWKIPQGPFI